MWLFIAFLAPTFYAVATILDNVLANVKFKNPLTLVFYTSLFNIIFLPILFLFQKPEIPPAGTIPIFILLGLINVAYLYPYYRGLQNEDTSVAIAFFGIGRIFIPFLAFLIVGEVLLPYQYLGILLIILSSTLLGLRRWHSRFLFSKAFWYIALAALITAFEGVLLKYLFERGVNLGTAIGGEMIVALLTAMFLFMTIRVLRKDVIANKDIFRKNFTLFAAEETFTFLAFAAESYAIAIAPVSIIKSITMFTPFFALFYAKFLGKRFSGVFKEEVDGKSVLKKTILFILMVLGVILLKN